MSGEILKKNGLWGCSPVLEHSPWYKTISLEKKKTNLLMKSQELGTDGEEELSPDSMSGH